MSCVQSREDARREGGGREETLTPPLRMASSCASLSASYSAASGKGASEAARCVGYEEGDLRPVSLSGLRMLRKATQYHSRSSSSGSSSSSQLNASAYGALA